MVDQERRVQQEVRAFFGGHVTNKKEGDGSDQLPTGVPLATPVPAMGREV